MNKKNNLIVVVLAVIMIVSMLASMIACIWMIEKVSKENNEQDSVLIAARVHDSISKDFLRPITVAETMANDSSLIRMLQDGAEDAEIIKPNMAAYLDSIRSGFGYQMVFTVSEQNRAYYTYDGISKYVDPVRDEHDTWYSDFCAKNTYYELNVDTDEANNWDLSVFVNVQIVDETGRFLGCCGVGVTMEHLQELLRQYERQYNIKINLVNETGLIQVDSDAKRIERDYLDNTELENTDVNEFAYKREGKSCIVTKYMEDLGWYLIVRDDSPREIDAQRVVTPSINIFLLGLAAMGTTYLILHIRRRRLREEIAEKTRISKMDELTGLHNRRAYEEDRAPMADVYACFENGRLVQAYEDVVLVMMDVNGLKTLNDAKGHEAGDELLKAAANTMEYAFSEYGRVYRTGGDEFAAILHCSAEDVANAVKRMDNIAAKWEGIYTDELNIAKGVMCWAEHERLSWEELEKLADQAMYADKDDYYRRTGKERRRV